MNEYIVKLKIGTDWHEPHNTTTYNYDTDVYSAPNAKEAIRQALSHYSNLMNHPNKSFKVVSVKKV